jgi:hypothetical protein
MESKLREGPVMKTRSIVAISAALLLLPSIVVFARAAKPDATVSKDLQPESKLLLIRNVSGEFAKAMQPLPGGKKGFTVRVGKPIDERHLRDALRLQGTAAGIGDRVQITNLDFRSQAVVVEINGGGRKHFHLRDHLQVGMGAGPIDAPPPASHSGEGTGAVLILDYGQPVPDMTSDDLKRDLSTLLDFSGEHSASTNWVETLPTQFQQGIKDHHAVLGMNREILIAAMGRPDKKVREKDDGGNETEDWIYGTPPDKTTFVTFSGDTVIRIKEYN